MISEERYAVYRDREDFYWLVDTAFGSTWSPDVALARRFFSHDDAVNALKAPDLVKPDVNWSDLGFVIVRLS